MGLIQSVVTPELLEVVEVVDDTLPVAALVAGERAGVIDALVVARLAVGEAVDDELIDDFVAPVVDVGRSGSRRLAARRSSPLTQPREREGQRRLAVARSSSRSCYCDPPFGSDSEEMFDLCARAGRLSCT